MLLVHSVMIAVVGSRNPVKIAAARAVLSRVYGEGVQVEACSVQSCISDQPWGAEETLRGALNRALAALSVDGASLGVGLEGGLVEVDGHVLTLAMARLLTPAYYDQRDSISE
jgi:non-canonical (house-cleaning) NTP pyrophosphatase